jgi:hypothetical protein
VSPKTLVVGLGTVAVALALVGVALSRQAQDAPGPVEAAKVFRKAPGTEKTRRSPRVDGRTWSLRTYDNRDGDVCVTHTVPSEAVGTGCIARDKLFARGPLLAYRGARQIAGTRRKLGWDNQWIYGFVHPAVRSLTLVNLNCSTLRVPFDKDGAFHYVIGRRQLKRREVPYKLLARGARGELLAERVFAVTLPWDARAAGMKRPKAGRACS